MTTERDIGVDKSTSSNRNNRLRRLSFPALMILLGISTSLTFADDAMSQSADFDIPPQSVESALHEFSRQADVQVMVGSPSVAGQRTSGVKGRLSAASALTQLLQHTNLTYETVGGGNTVTVKRVAAATIAEPQEAAPEQTPSQEKDALTKSANPPASSETSRNYDNGKRARGALEEIIVTAQKRQQALIDVPISITAISGDALEEAGTNNIQDLSFAVPSMSAAEISPGRQLITLRGMGGSRGNSSLTGVYLDEMPISGLQDGFIATYPNLGTTDLERVEVLKGPQGTLFGEGSVGGTVRFVTKDPELTGAGGKVTASLFGNRNSDDLSGEVHTVLNLPVVRDKFGLRAEAVYENKAGWIDRVQTVNGPVIEEDFNDSELVNVRVKGLWAPADSLTVKGMVVVHRNEGGGSNIVNLEPRKDSNFIIEFDPTMPIAFTDDYELYNLTATYALGFAELLSSTSYSNMSSVTDLAQRKPLIPAPNPGFLELFTREYERDASAFSQELRLSSTGSGPLNWTAGAYYKDDELVRSYPLGADFFRFGRRLGAGPFNVGLKDENQSEAWAVFGDLSYALTPRLELGGGVRYFEEDRKNVGQTAPNVPVPSRAGSFDATTYRGYLSFAVTRNARAYGSVSTGFRSGGFNGAAVIAAGGPRSFDPEFVTSYELGTKMALGDGRVRMQAALFYSEYTDIQMNSVFIAPNGIPVGFTGNPGEAEIKGVEAELNWVVTDRLTFGLSGDITDTELTKVDPRVQPAQFVVGDPIDYVPEYSVATTVDYGVDWSQSVPGFVRVQYSQQGKTTSSLRTLDALEPITHTPILDFLNASIGAKWNGWEFELFGRNLLDEAGALRTGNLDPQARPRTIGVRFEKLF